MTKAPALLLAAALLAGTALADPAKVYEGLMSDSELYSGEGIVSLSTYGNDLEKAKVSARTRARAALSEAIKVRIKSTVTDVMTKDGGELEARAESVSELELENVQYKVLEGFPKAGQLTAVATLSREDYERQLAGKRRTLFRMRKGFRLYGGLRDFRWANQADKDYGPSAPGYSSQAEASSGDMYLFGADFYYRSWVLGLQGYFGNIKLPYRNEATGQTEGFQGGYMVPQLSAGYDLTPWAVRVQPYVPLRVNANYLRIEPHSAAFFGASGGLGLRYWANDEVCLDFKGIYHLPLGSSDFSDGSKRMIRWDGKPYAIDAEGIELSLGIIFMGF